MAEQKAIQNRDLHIQSSAKKSPTPRYLLTRKNVFAEQIFLQPGYNVIKIEVMDKFKKRVTKKIKIVYKE